ncbi:MAG: hypothetical protein H7X88_01810 [Gloeobacteraceae cyanobacterium ES-bin-316]|nr:hypothetical protein [Ferruginibacter sp.]
MKITGNEPAYPTGMYGQQTSPGLTIFQQFCLHAPPMPDSFLKSAVMESTDKILQWHVFYAMQMIEKINEQTPQTVEIIYQSKLNEILEGVIDLLEIGRPAHIERAIDDLKKLIK